MADKHQQHADMLAGETVALLARIAELEAEVTTLEQTHDTLHRAAKVLKRERDEARAIAKRAAADAYEAIQQRDEARAEVERLRGVCQHALDAAWDAMLHSEYGDQALIDDLEDALAPPEEE